ncbi:MAG TPA: DinB family protein [Thermoanaerobaculia bacterium]
MKSTALAATLTTQFRMNEYIANANLDGITHEDSLVRAIAGGNTLNWVAGHIVSTRCHVLPALRREPVWKDEQMRLYSRAMAVAGDTELLPFDEVVRALRLSLERLLDGIAALSDEELAAPAPFNPGPDPETIGSLLTKMAIHEAYHLGQTGILRRVAGKAGAIR